MVLKLGLFISIPSILILIISCSAILVAAGKAENGSGKCPDECDKDTCPDMGYCEEPVIDECDCCQVCIRQSGESCGQAGQICDNHLTCHLENSIEEQGVCKAMKSDKCLKAKCPIVFNPACPNDSKLVVVNPPPGECCGQRGTCQCDQQKCVPFVPTCTRSEELVITKKGSDEPGKCCDTFECKRKNKRCENVNCPSRIFDEDEGRECPPDSVRPPDHINHDSCCPMVQPCRCRASICVPAQCTDGYRVKLLERGNGSPGKCCDQWRCEEEDVNSVSMKCSHNGKEYKNDEMWHNSTCDVCKCKKGVAVCEKKSCPTLPRQCSWIVVPDGECCPVCFGCQTDDMEKKKPNETWHKDDCTTCTCSDDGQPLCTKTVCQKQCENPRKIEGECCPHCDEPTYFQPPTSCPSLEHCSLRCANGLREDEDGCYVCQCLPGLAPPNSKCDELNEDNCDKQCAHGYLSDIHGCHTCRCNKCPPLHKCFKHCVYGFEENSSGCAVCKCRAVPVEESKDNKNKVATKGSQKEEKCIKLSNDGKQIVRDSGEWWSDGCRHCFCENGHEYCSLISCLPRPSDCDELSWIQKEGECCPSCVGSKQKPAKVSSTSVARQQKHEVCQSPGTGRLFTDGETWTLAACVSCTCRIGHVLCRHPSCPPLACKNPFFENDDDCCAVCPELKVESVKDKEGNAIVCTDLSGAAHIAGSSWREDDCTSCVCNGDGKTDCFRETCDETECRGDPLAIKGKCCSICSDALSLSSSVCAFQSSIYTIGEEWQDGQCSNCTCVAGGQTICRQLVCPHCEDPVPIEGHCCPLCKDGGLATYRIGNSSISVYPNSLGPRISQNSTGGEQSMAVSFLIVSMMSLAVVGLLIVLLFLYRKNRKSNKLHKFNEVGQMSSGGASTVRLSASKAIGSMPRLVDWKDTREGSGEELIKSTHIRHDSHNSQTSVDDDQSDGLLSTMSDTSTAPSTVSSGNAPIGDTEPLTPNRSARRLPV